MKPGFYRQSFEDYINGDGINRSFLHELISKSPGHAKWKQDNPEITDALRLGDAFHAAILEPERFEKEYTVLPDDCRPGSGAGMKARKELFEAEAGRDGKTIINKNDYQNIREMQAVIQSDQNAIELLSDGEAEVSGYFIDPDYDTLVKVRLDWINKKRGLVVDLKSAADARMHLFRASAYNHGYDIQSWMGLYVTTQITGIPHEDFRFICIESKGYHGLKIYQADQDMLASGRDRYCQAMETYIECVERNEWSGYDSTCEPLGVPNFVKERNNFYE